MSRQAGVAPFPVVWPRSRRRCSSCDPARWQTRACRTVHRRAAAFQHEPGSGRRVPVRRHRREHHEQPGAGPALAGDAAQHGVPLQIPRHRSSSHRSRAERPHGAHRPRQPTRRQPAGGDGAARCDGGVAAVGRAIPAQDLDLFALEEEIALKISGSLRTRITGEQKAAPAKRFTENTEAYQLY